MIRKWFTIIAVGLIAEVIGFITILLGNYINPDVSLPSIIQLIIPTPGLSTVIANIFSTTITINGIILGFFAVCIIFRLEVYNSYIRRCDEALLKTQNTTKKSMLESERDGLAYLRGDVSRYAEIYVKLSILLMLFQAILFSGSYSSGALAIISLIFSLNALLIIGSGLYAFLSLIFGIYVFEIVR